MLRSSQSGVQMTPRVLASEFSASRTPMPPPVVISADEPTPV